VIETIFGKRGTPIIATVAWTQLEMSKKDVRSYIPDAEQRTIPEGRGQASKRVRRGGSGKGRQPP
jgi:hypothetical protein